MFVITNMEADKIFNESVLCKIGNTVVKTSGLIEYIKKLKGINSNKLSYTKLIDDENDININLNYYMPLFKTGETIGNYKGFDAIKRFESALTALIVIFNHPSNSMADKDEFLKDAYKLWLRMDTTDVDVKDYTLEKVDSTIRTLWNTIANDYYKYAKIATKDTQKYRRDKYALTKYHFTAKDFALVYPVYKNDSKEAYRIWAEKVYPNILQANYENVVRELALEYQLESYYNNGYGHTKMTYETFSKMINDLQLTKLKVNLPSYSNFLHITKRLGLIWESKRGGLHIKDTKVEEIEVSWPVEEIIPTGICLSNIEGLKLINLSSNKKQVSYKQVKLSDIDLNKDGLKCLSLNIVDNGRIDDKLSLPTFNFS